MNRKDNGAVCVIIPAYNAARTIADAVRTSLAQPEVEQVIVVDDASEDDTAAAARASARGDARLIVMERNVNQGPAAARNLALDAARAPWVGVVDSDDFVLPGRFARLTAVPDCEIVADNIMFVHDETGPGNFDVADERDDSGAMEVDLTAFVRANFPGDSDRREWGFLKPVIRRDFLQRHGLRYDDRMRLGEDYDLYVRMLLRGARFRVLLQTGYVARWRTDSLSAQHRTADLCALAGAARRHLEFSGLSRDATEALKDQERNTRQRFLLRQFLDTRARNGRIGAVLAAARKPDTLMPIIRGVLGDKLASRRPVATRSRIGSRLIKE